MRLRSFSRAIGALFISCASVLVCWVFLPTQAAVAQQARNSCPKNNIRGVKVPSSNGASKSLRFCIEGDFSRVWLEAESGTNFGRMASLCCKEPITVIENTWKELEKDKQAKAGMWYPLKKANLGEDVLAGLEPREEQRTEPPNPNSPGPDQSVAEVPKDPTPEVPNNNNRDVRDKRTLEGDQREDKNRLVFYAIGFVAALASVIIASVTYMGARNKKAKFHEKRGDSRNRGYTTVSDVEDKSQSTTLGGEDAEKLKELSVLLVERLAEAMRQAVENAFPQKGAIELAPPTSRISEWVSFFRLVKEELDRSSLDSDRGGGPGTYNGFSTNADLGLGNAPLLDKRVFPKHQVYVELQVDYKDGSRSFGGRPIFQETNDRRASFYVEPGDREEGLLLPNPDARTYDNAYYTFFGIGRNDFPMKGEIKPQRVRCEGGQWVLASSSW